MRQVDRKKLQSMLQQEIERFARDHAKCHAHYEKAKGCLLDGVPMTGWCAGRGVPLVCHGIAKGHPSSARMAGNIIDFCLGDTGAMVGHSPDVPMKKIAEQLS
jgi:glutamate-1-semialdehyde aminotransferase